MQLRCKLLSLLQEVIHTCIMCNGLLWGSHIEFIFDLKFTFETAKIFLIRKYCTLERFHCGHKYCLNVRIL